MLSRALRSTAACTRLSAVLRIVPNQSFPSQRIRSPTTSLIRSRQLSLFSSSSSVTDTTATQAKIAKLESDANASPDDLDRQVELFKVLLDGGAENAVVARWNEAVKEGAQSNIVASNEAFDLYLLALARTGNTQHIAEAVRQRDSLLTGSTLTSSAQSSSTSSAPSAEAASTSSFARLNPFSNSSNSSTPAAAAASGGAPTTPLTELGAPAKPVHVVLEQSKTFSAAQVARSLGVNALYIFCFLTLASLILENTGLLKAGNQPAEFDPEKMPVVKFSDVLGCDEAKELEEVVEFLRSPEKFSKLGGKLPKGVLLTGPPGTGKTLLARAVAGEAGVPFFYASGSSFEQMYVGVGAARVRELFAAAKKRAPAIIFLDELDAVGSRRTSKDHIAGSRQTLLEILTQLDGFLEAEGIIVIGATNFPATLDSALTRPGRFDRHVVVPLPDLRGRSAILHSYMQDVEFDVDVDPMIIARGTPGMSGADLRNLVNTAAIRAAKEHSTHVKLPHFEWAKDRILMGAERRSHYVSPESRKMTAYHEAGHALTSLFTKAAMPLHKVTIAARGAALGITFSLPTDDRDSVTLKELKASIDVALGGRVAEELIYGKEDTTSGCSSDLQRASQVAGAMVKNYGFSEKVGLVAHSDEDLQYLSGAKKDEIESETRKFVEEGYQRVQVLLKEREKELHTLANALVEYETLSADEVRDVLSGKRLDRVGNVGPALREPEISPENSGLVAIE